MIFALLYALCCAAKIRYWLTADIGFATFDLGYRGEAGHRSEGYLFLLCDLFRRFGDRVKGGHSRHTVKTFAWPPEIPCAFFGSQEEKLELPEIITCLPEIELPLPPTVVKTNALKYDGDVLVFFHILKEELQLLQRMFNYCVRVII